MPPSSGYELRIGVDIGGTFTDFVYLDPAASRLECFKLLSTPADPSEAVMEGLRIIFSRTGLELGCTVIHGSTVATNALLERKGAQTALVTTRGFRDVLQIGRQNRPSLYDLNAYPSPPLVPDELRLEVTERIDSHGCTLTPLALQDLEEVIAFLKTTQVESVAVSLLFSFLDPEHEQICTRRLEQSGYFVSASSEVLPEFREYERTSTTVVNAYVTPVLNRYLSRLQSELRGDFSAASSRRPVRLQVMQSNGGMISPREAGRSGVRCILSGPAGGIVAAQRIGSLAWSEEQIAILPPHFRERWVQSDSALRLITFDMGGTSTDVSLIDGIPQVTTETVLGGCPIGLPVLDIHSIGAGGGSIASVDLGGAFRVGPNSAGADPGPACYGRGDPVRAYATVTDANLLLGRLPADSFLGGKMRLDADRSLGAISSLGRRLGLNPQETALGIIEIANTHMQRALGVISLERGHDPRQFTLLSYGGAGGLHAVDLAASLGIPRVLVPLQASTFSALGMLTADVIKDYSQTVMRAGNVTTQELDNLLAPLSARGIQDLLSEGIAEGDIRIEPYLDIRYRGQSYELMIPYSSEFLSRFHRSHEARYGYSRLGAEIEVVNIRVKAIGNVSPPPIFHSERYVELHEFGDPAPASGYRDVYIQDAWQRVPYYKSGDLLPAMGVVGPALVVCPDTTVLVGVGWFMVVGLCGCLLMVNGYTN